MPRPTSQYGCWPLEDQEWLLRAALLDGTDATLAWQAWQRRVDLEAIDAGSLRLLPLVYRNLTRLGVSSTSLGRVRGVYRQSWYKNHLIIGRLAGLLRALHAAGIETLVLKGVPLGLQYYEDVALRPMVDADVLVPASKAFEALGVVRAAGWAPKDDPIQWPPRFTASRAFGDHLGVELDLHCHVLHECLREGADDDFWAGARRIEVGGVATLALCSADQLLHIVVHGLRRSRMPPVRWVADATTVIRTNPELDWDRLVAQAQQRRLSRILASGLDYVHTNLGVAVPPRVIRVLETTPASLTERLERWARSRPGAVRLGVETWCDYARSAGREPRWRGSFGFLHYIKDRLGVATVWQLPSAAAAKLRPPSGVT